MGSLEAVISTLDEANEVRGEAHSAFLAVLPRVSPYLPKRYVRQR